MLIGEISILIRYLKLWMYELRRHTHLELLGERLEGS